MKNKVYYILIVVLLLICSYLGYENLNKNEYVFRVYEIAETPAEWYKPIVKSVNEETISLSVDGMKMTENNGKIIMNDMMEIMLPINCIADTFDCAVYQYDENSVTIEKASTLMVVNVGESTIKVNNIEIPLKVKTEIIDNKIYIPVAGIAEGLSYDYRWNAFENVVIMTNESTQKYLPYRYDYRTVYRNSKIENQGKYGTCWAFASLTALESSLLPLKKIDFAIEHMVLNNNMGTTMNSGGDYIMSMAYLSSWKGPVLESDDAYGDGKSDASLEEVVHVQEIQIIESKDYEKIKEMVYKYGGVQSSLYTNMVGATSKSQYYNKNNSAYCYIGTQKPNHDVVIIGWDDSYPKENFNDVPDSDGAFICQNSWGEKFGEEGIFYVSYYDSNIGMHNIVYTGIEETDNYDNIYQSDLCGMVGYMGYGKEDAYFANVYTARTREEVVAASFYATGTDTAYTIYLVNDFKNVEQLASKRIKVASGMLVNAGYYTIDFDRPMEVAEGERYAIVVSISTPNSTKPVAVEYYSPSLGYEVDLADGEGYISWSGRSWENTESVHECNICLKAFTNVVS